MTWDESAHPRDDNGRFGIGGFGFGGDKQAALARMTSGPGSHVSLAEFEAKARAVSLDGVDLVPGVTPLQYQAFTAWEQSLTPEEKEAVERYSDSMYRYVNGGLRGADVPADLAEKGMQLVPALDSAVSKGVLLEDRELFRGIRQTADMTIRYRDLQPGQTFTDPGFGSFTTNVTMAEEFAGNPDVPLVLRVEAERGDNYVQTQGPPESEFLAPRGQTYEVLANQIDEEGDRIVDVKLR